MGTVAKQDAVVEHDGVRRKIIAGTEVPGVLLPAYEKATGAKVASDEPLAGYDELSAADVVERLASLSEEEKAKVLEYERNGKARKSILAAGE